MYIKINQDGIDAMAEYVQRRLGRLPAQMVDDARRLAPVDTGALQQSGHVVRLSAELWRISFGKGFPDPRAVVQELGADWVDENGNPRHLPAQPYIRPAVYRERAL